MRFDVVLQTFAAQKRLRSLIEQINHLPETELVDSLLKEFEQVCERYKSLSDFAAASAQKPLSIAPIAIGAPEIQLKFTTKEPALYVVPPVGESKEGLRKKLEDVETWINDEVRRDWDNKAGEIRERITRLKTSQLVLREQLSMMEQTDDSHKAGSISATQTPRESVVTIRDEDTLYLFGISANRESTEQTKCLREKGIDGKTPILTLSRKGMRFFLCVVNAEDFPITTSGMMLLGKQETLQLRLAHEEIVNRLRAVHSLLPFEFGSLVKGESGLFTMSETHLDQWGELLNQEVSVTPKRVFLYARDETIGSALGQRVTGKISVKILERVLQHEQKLAQTVHDSLKSVAASSALHSIVGLANGFSSEWKQILESSYDVEDQQREEFFFRIRDLQQMHSRFQLMFEVVGAAGRLNLRKQPQGISA